MEQVNSHKPVALIVGVTGMVGVALAEALKKPEALGGPWKVYGASRRSLPSWFSSSVIDYHLTLDALNGDDTHEKLTPISSEITHVFWVALQHCQREEENVNLNSTMLKNVISALQSSPASKLSHVTIQTGTKHYMGPIDDPSKSDQLIPHQPPFTENYPRLPFPSFYYALEDLIASYTQSFTHSIHRASIIMGASTRSLSNIVLTLSVYASISKYKGWPFRYPGTKYTWEHFCDMSDACVLAEQHIWAALTEKAKNQAFNCTNGDVFAWKSLWKALCEIFDLEFVPFHEKDGFDITEFMKDKEEIWGEIVVKYGLYKSKVEEITNFRALQIVLNFEFQHISSLNKSKEFGFFGYADTLKSLEFWVAKLRQMKIIL